jgi:hypothetical protein
MTDEFENELQTKLRASEAELDAPTLAKLHAARNRALGEKDVSRATPWLTGWLPVAAAASVAALAVWVVIAPETTAPTTDSSPATAMARPNDDRDDDQDNDQNNEQNNEQFIGDLETSLLFVAEADVLLDTDSSDGGASEPNDEEMLELLENLEFYEWLTAEEMEEQVS